MLGKRIGNGFNVILKIEADEESVLEGFLNKEYPELKSEELVRDLNFANGNDGLVWTEKSLEDQIMRRDQIRLLGIGKVTTDPPIVEELEPVLKIPDFLKRLKTQKEKEKKMGKIKIAIHFGKDLDDAKKEKISNLMEELSIKAADRKKYFENDGFIYPSSTMQKYDEYVSMFGDLAEVTYEEIPLTPKELLDEVIATDPEKFKGANGEKGDQGDKGDAGNDGKNAPWVKITICLAIGMILLSLIFARIFRPDANDLVASQVTQIIEKAGNKTVDSIFEHKQGAIIEINQARDNAVTKVQGVQPPVAIQTPPVQNPPVITQPPTATPPVTQAPTPKGTEVDPLDAFRTKP